MMKDQREREPLNQGEAVLRREMQKQVRALGHLTLVRDKCAELQKALDTVDTNFRAIEEAAKSAADVQKLRDLVLKFVQSRKAAMKLLKGFANSVERAQSALTSLDVSMHDNLRSLRAFDALPSLGKVRQERVTR